VTSIQIDRLVRSRRKTLTLVLRPDGTLEVRAPLGISAARIQGFVDSHAQWIEKQRQRVKAAAPPPSHNFVEGEKILYLGRECTLVFSSHDRPALRLEGSTFLLRRSAAPKARQIFIDWYKDQARELIAERMQVLSGKNGFKAGLLRISSARTRWGSCSSRGTLSFTYRLVMAPPAIIDYVIVHELVHLKVQNHSREFWNKVAQIMPEYHQHRSWLRKNGKFLVL